MPKPRLIPYQGVVECYFCALPMLTYVLPAVRQIKCPRCKVLHPAKSANAVALFLNETKQLDGFFAYDPSRTK